MEYQIIILGNTLDICLSVEPVRFDWSEWSTLYEKQSAFCSYLTIDLSAFFRNPVGYLRQSALISTIARECLFNNLVPMVVVFEEEAQSRNYDSDSFRKLEFAFAGDLCKKIILTIDHISIMIT